MFFSFSSVLVTYKFTDTFDKTFVKLTLDKGFSFVETPCKNRFVAKDRWGV